jgi:hypothetical protein
VTIRISSSAVVKNVTAAVVMNGGLGQTQLGLFLFLLI